MCSVALEVKKRAIKTFSAIEQQCKRSNSTSTQQQRRCVQNERICSCDPVAVYITRLSETERSEFINELKLKGLLLLKKLLHKFYL